MRWQKERPGQCGSTGTGPESAEASNLKTNNTTVLRFPSDHWQIAMMRAHAIRFYQPGPVKSRAVRHWRIAVQDALAVEVLQ